MFHPIHHNSSLHPLILPESFKISPLSVIQGILILLTHLILIALTAYLFSYIMKNHGFINIKIYPIICIFLYFFSVFFIATRMRALGNILHECSHFSFVKPKKLNSIFGCFIASLELSSFNQYQKSHFKHHRYLGIKEKDGDFQKYLLLMRCITQQKIVNNSTLLFFSVVCHPKNWFFYLLSTFSLKEKKKIFIYFKILYILILILFCFFHPVNFILFLLIPYTTFYQAMKISSDFLDHHNSYYKDDWWFRTNNHIFRSGLLNILIFPRHDAYHLVHHLYPYLPTYQLNLAHKYLLQYNKKYAAQKHFIG